MLLMHAADASSACCPLQVQGSRDRVDESDVSSLLKKIPVKLGSGKLQVGAARGWAGCSGGGVGWGAAGLGVVVAGLGGAQLGCTDAEDAHDYCDDVTM
jgi:hypothetical protein